MDRFTALISTDRYVDIWSLAPTDELDRLINNEHFDKTFICTSFKDRRTCWIIDSVVNDFVNKLFHPGLYLKLYLMPICNVIVSKKPFQKPSTKNINYINTKHTFYWDDKIHKTYSDSLLCYSKYFTTTKNYIYSYCIYLLVLLPGCCATGAGAPSSASSAGSRLDLLPPAGHLLLGQEDLAVEEHNQEQRDEERACK